MSEIVKGFVAELGGKEVGKTGKEKPRKVVVKEDSSQQYGKTLRCWSNIPEFDVLTQAANVGNQVEVHYDVREIPGTEFTQNMVVDVVPLLEGGNGSEPIWGGGDNAGAAPSGSPTHASATPAPQSKDDYWARREAGDEERTRQMIAAWSIEQAIRLGFKDSAEVHDTAHKLIVLKDRIASELSSS